MGCWIRRKNGVRIGAGGCNREDIPCYRVDIRGGLGRALGMARSSTTYPPKWNSGKTTVIRVPQRIADQLLDIAWRLDASPKYRLREDGNTFVLELVPAGRVK
jgi:hypothetical protein